MLSPATQESIESQLVKSRLGAFAGLFFALRAKHPPSADHSLRVAIGCSKWADFRNLEESSRLTLEVAALLHDIGKIGIPDSVLQKPERLNAQEQTVMEMHSRVAIELLRGAGATEDLLRIVSMSHASDLVDASPDTEVQDVEKTKLPAQMLRIVDAFDSMTTEQTYRSAASRERAIEELFANAGTQFQPELSREFVDLISQPRPELEKQMAQHWLSSVGRQQAGAQCEGFADFGSGATQLPVSSGAVQNLIDTLFHRRLLDSLADAVIYIDASGQILHWNQAAEQMSGKRAASIIHRRWAPALLGLCGQQGEPLPEAECPRQLVLQSNTTLNQNYLIQCPDHETLSVRVTAMPVVSGNREVAGVILVARDSSAEQHLEQKVQSLNEIANQDGLTKVSNRAALDRRLPAMIEKCIELGHRGSIMICDIDFFKRINDTYGHQAGDDALVTFASILKEQARDEDMVARFGGEEFVLLCDGCDNPVATARAETIRQAVEKTPVPSLKGKTITASFGVTEIQEGDTADTVMARADRALLMAKENGRNRVVQLGAGQEPTQQKAPRKLSDNANSKASWLAWFRTGEQTLLERDYLAAVPKTVAVQKLEGFIADHKAEVMKIEDSHIALRIEGSSLPSNRRNGERPFTMLVDIRMTSVKVMLTGRQKGYASRTMFGVVVSPVKARDRRSSSLHGQVEQVLQSFQAYMVAQPVDEEMRPNIIMPR